MFTQAHRWAVVAGMCWGLTLGASRAAAADPEPERFYAGASVVRCYPFTWEAVEQLRGLHVQLLSDSEAPGQVDYVIWPDSLAELDALGIPYATLVQDLQRGIEAERQRLAAAPPTGARDATWYEDFKTYDQIVEKLNAFVTDYPDLCTLFSIGQTLEGREIWALRITGSGQAKPGVLYFGTQHAREWASPMVNMWIAEHLLSGYATDTQLHLLLDSVEFFILPVINADGYVYSWASPANRLWRKNRRLNPGGCYGVDPNRNWSVDWGGFGASSDPCSETYHGPTAFSEPCTIALRDFIVAHPSIELCLDIHSFSQLILTPWGHTPVLPPDHDWLMELAGGMSDAIYAVHSMYYDFGPGYSSIYPTSGDMTDWAYGERDIAAFTVEVRDTGLYGFLMPPEEIIPTCEENFAGAVEIAVSGLDLRDCNENGVEDGQDIASGFSEDCNSNGIPDECEIGWDQDCNENGIADLCDIGVGTSLDCNGNFIPDECDLADGTSADCNENDIPDDCEVGGTTDCNGNGVPDLCDIYTGFSEDCSGDGVPSECEPDCNDNGVADDCDLVAGTAPDCNGNNVPDSCDLVGIEYVFPLDEDPHWSTEGEWEFGQPTGQGGDEWDFYAPDPTSGATGDNVYGVNLNGNYSLTETDRFYLTAGPFDCRSGASVNLRFQRWLNMLFEPYGSARIEVSNDGVNWELYWTIGTQYFSEDAWSLQEYDISYTARHQPTVWIRWGYSQAGLIEDLSSSGWNIDDIEIICASYSTDCNGNDVPDECDLAAGTSADCNTNDVPDECELADGSAFDCNENGVLDECDLADGTSLDCNFNRIPDECDIADGTSQDCNENGVPDLCDLVSGFSVDCNDNDIPDACDLAGGTSQDCNENGIPDECDIAAGTSLDCNGNGVPDACDLTDGTSLDCNGNGIPDDCDVLPAPFSVTSDEFAPLGGQMQTYLLTTPATAAATVTLTFTALGDIKFSNEYVDVDINGVPVGTVYTGTYLSCAPDQVDTLEVPVGIFNAAAASGEVAINMVPSATVHPAACGGDNWIQVAVTYPQIPLSTDTNNNGVPDECETCRGDDNCDGVVDFDDIDYFVVAMQGVTVWQNYYSALHGGTPPPCPYANCDVDGNGVVDMDDIDPFIARIGAVCD